MYKIVIPSYNRPNNKFTMSLASQKYKCSYPVFIVVRQSQYDDYYNFILKNNLSNITILAIEDDKINSSSKVRNMILKHDEFKSDDHIFMLDDDINKFYITSYDENRNIVINNKISDLDEFFKLWEACMEKLETLDDRIYSSVPDNSNFNKWHSYDMKYPAGIQMQCICLNIKKLRDNDIYYNEDLKTADDIDLMLQAMDKMLFPSIINLLSFGYEDLQLDNFNLYFSTLYDRIAYSQEALLRLHGDRYITKCKKSLYGNDVGHRVNFIKFRKANNIKLKKVTFEVEL